MKKEEIVSILSDWNFWGRDLEIGRSRSYSERIVGILEEKINKIVSVYGVRRSGKSYILRQVAKKLSEKYGKENVLYVNFEEISFGRKDLKLLNEIYSSFVEIIKPTRKPFILLDEIQEVAGWEKWVRSMHEKNECKFVVSGSSAKLMSEEFVTLLSGRDITIEVFPLSFKEFLEFKDVKIDKKSEIVMRKDLIMYLREYAEFGGFPEIIETKNEERKKEILRRYFETILIKDVQKRYNIREVDALEFIAQYYLSNISSLISFNKISKFLKIPVKTVERFSKYLESSRMLFFVPKFSFGLKERKIASRKVYSIDTGISNVYGFRMSENYGKIIENLVAVSLLRSRNEIFYFRDYQQREVDFVIKEGLRVKQLIQVTYASERDDIEKREIKSLLKAAEVFKKDRPELLVITWDYEDEVELKERRIKFVPLWKWLLRFS